MRICSVEGCGGKHEAKGLCRKHYTRYKRHKDPLITLIEMNHKGCSIEGCREKHKAKGLCRKHYSAEHDAKYSTNSGYKKRKAEWDAKSENKKRRAKYGANPKNKKRESDRKIKAKYGITPNQYQKVLNSQDNKCAICESRASGMKSTARFSIDHEHIEGYKKMSAEEKMKYFRGLLCHHCNCILKEGYENKEIFYKYINYLKNPPAKELNLKYTKRKVKIFRQALIFRLGNKCWIDSSHQPSQEVFSVDHNHLTKDIRGLLCKNCNAILGSARDSPEILENAIKYLENYQDKKEKYEFTHQE